MPIVHFSEAQPPVVICVALDRTDGAFEANLHRSRYERASTNASRDSIAA